MTTKEECLKNFTQVMKIVSLEKKNDTLFATLLVEDVYSKFHTTTYNNVALVGDLLNTKLLVGDKILANEMYRYVVSRDGDAWYEYECTKAMIIVENNGILQKASRKIA